VRPVPFHSETGQNNDVVILQKYFDDVPKSFHPEQLRYNEIFVTMRYHGAVFACQMGLPFVALAYQNKSSEFCREIGCESLSLSVFKHRKLESRIDRVRNEADRLRKYLIEISEGYRTSTASALRELRAQL
jgi:polysaccharide pyruvyl transferase WcaK-like protein